MGPGLEGVLVVDHGSHDLRVWDDGPDDSILGVVELDFQDADPLGKMIDGQHSLLPVGCKRSSSLSVRTIRHDPEAFVQDLQ